MSFSYNPIKVLSAPCGAGKSHTIRQESNERVLTGKRVLISVPSKRLADRYVEHFAKEFPTLLVEVIHTDTIDEDERAVVVISQRLRDDTPRVIIITQAAFNILASRSFYQQGTINKIVDEIPTPFKMMRYNDAEGIKRLLPLIEAVPADKHHEYYTVHCRNNSELRKIAAERDKDGKTTDLQNFTYQLLSTNYLNVVSKKDWDEHKTETIDLYSLMNGNIYSGFKDVIIAGACFNDSALFKLWSKIGIDFTADRKLLNNMRYQKHQNGSQLKVYYSIKGHNWSKWIMQEKDENGKPIKNEDGNNIHEGHNFRLIEQAVSKLFDGEFAYNSNLNYKVFEGVERAKYLDQYIYGLNEYDDTLDVACLSARNLDSNFSNFLKAFVELTHEEIRNCIGRQFTYQSALRGALRNPHDDRPKRAYIPDEGTARWFADMFEGCELIYLPVEGLKLPKAVGRPRINKTEAERKARDAARKAKKRREASPFGEFMNAPTSTDFQGSLFKSIRSKKACSINRTSADFDQLLEQKSLVFNSSKSDNRLISPAYFEMKDGVKTERGKQNVVFANGIWLDFDGVKGKTTKALVKQPIDPKELPKYWKFKFVVFNSYSSTKDWRKYRVYIPTDRTVTLDEYSNITDTLVGLLPDENGIDYSKLHAACLFYLPSQPNDISAYYFERFDGDVLCVDGYTEEPHQEAVHSDLSISGPSGPQSTESQPMESVEAIINQYGLASAPDGCGNDFIFKMGMELIKVGLDHIEVERILNQQANSAKQTSRDDRMNDVVRFMGRWDEWHATVWWTP
jgi:hypothetical protein